MICCEKCFKDVEIKAIINSYGNLGKCDLCGIDNVCTYNTEEDTYLIEIFEGLFDIYVEANKFEEGFPIENLKLLKDELKEKWDIFEDYITPFMVGTLVKNICQEYFENRSSLLE